MIRLTCTFVDKYRVNIRKVLNEVKTSQLIDPLSTSKTPICQSMMVKTRLITRHMIRDRVASHAAANQVQRSDRAIPTQSRSPPQANLPIASSWLWNNEPTHLKTDLAFFPARPKQSTVMSSLKESNACNTRTRTELSILWERILILRRKCSVVRLTFLGTTSKHRLAMSSKHEITRTYHTCDYQTLILMVMTPYGESHNEVNLSTSDQLRRKLSLNVRCRCHPSIGDKKMRNSISTTRCLIDWTRRSRAFSQRCSKVKATSNHWKFNERNYLHIWNISS